MKPTDILIQRGIHRKKIVLFFSLLILGDFDGVECCLNTLQGGDLEGVTLIFRRKIRVLFLFGESLVQIGIFSTICLLHLI